MGIRIPGLPFTNNQRTSQSLDGRIDRVCGAKVVWYAWNSDVTTEGSALGGVSAMGFSLLPGGDALSSSSAYDVSEFLISFSFQKSKDAAAGSFTMELAPSFDWSRFMRPGDWMTVYLSSDGAIQLGKKPRAGGFNLTDVSKALSLGAAALGLAARPAVPVPRADPKELKNLKPYVRCMLQVQRVATRCTVNSEGTREVVFTISGKDHGVVLEDTTLFLDAGLADAKAMKAFASSQFPGDNRNLAAFMDRWMDAFLNPTKIYGSTLDPTGGNPSLFKQFILPGLMLDHLGIKTSGGTFFGDIKGVKDVHPTGFETGLEDPFSGLEGSAWSKLKELSDPTFHELFAEMDDTGHPRVTFRPIPWARDRSGYPSLGAFVPLYSDHAGIGTGLGQLGNLAALGASALAAGANLLGGKLPGPLPQPTSKYAPINLSTAEVFEYDLGPDLHNLQNLIVADTAYASSQLSTAMALFRKPAPDVSNPFPFRNYASIKRFGLKYLQVQIKNFKTTAGGFAALAGVSKAAPDRGFLLEANRMLVDMWFGASDLYSGTVSIAGRNDVRIGKCLVTDSDLAGASDHVFYVEGYQDSVTVDENGTVDWTQSVQVSRGIEKSDLLTLREGALQDRAGFDRVSDQVPSSGGF